MVLLENPEINEGLVERISQALKEKKNIILVGACTSSYSGRAASELELGERILIIKSDNTVLLHGKTQKNAINWQPSNNIITVTIENGDLTIRSERIKPVEYLTIRFKSLKLACFFDLIDDAELLLMGSEKDMADMICKHPDIISDDFEVLNTELNTKYGIIDIWGRYKSTGDYVVIELKRGKAGLDAVDQLNRYVMLKRKEHPNNVVHGIVGAPEITDNAMELLNLYGHSFKKVVPPKEKK